MPGMMPNDGKHVEPQAWAHTPIPDQHQLLPTQEQCHPASSCTVGVKCLPMLLNGESRFIQGSAASPCFSLHHITSIMAGLERQSRVPAACSCSPWNAPCSALAHGGSTSGSGCQTLPLGHGHCLQLLRGHERGVLALGAQLLVALAALLQGRVPALIGWLTVCEICCGSKS